MNRGAQGQVECQGDSNAAIVKGLLSMVFILYHQLTPQQIDDFDVRPFCAELMLSQHLTSSRFHGLEAMNRAIRSKAILLV